MKIVFASSRTASNKRKICQQKIDFDINASTNKLQLLSENILITLKNGFVCYFSGTLFVYSSSELDIVIIPLEYETEWHHSVVLVSSHFSLLISVQYYLVSFGFWLENRQLYTRKQFWHLLVTSQEKGFLLLTDDSMVISSFMTWWTKIITLRAIHSAANFSKWVKVLE